MALRGNTNERRSIRTPAAARQAARSEANAFSLHPGSAAMRWENEWQPISWATSQPAMAATMSRP